MTDNKIIGAFKRLLTMTLALVMVLGASMPLMTQESYAAFTGKKGNEKNSSIRTTFAWQRTDRA